MLMLLHAAYRETILSEWETPAGIVIPLAISAAWYARGVYVVRKRAPGRGLRTWEILCFAMGWLTLALALVSPLHPLGEELFSAHMVQHTLLMSVAAPLLVLGRPLVPFLWALPAPWRGPLGHRLVHSPIAPLWQKITHPLWAWIIQAAVLLGWHTPRLYTTVLESESVHALQHVSFIVAALLFWWSIFHSRADRYGSAVIALFTTAMYSGALGALITVAPTVWYPLYERTAPAWGLTALEDQQLAGLIMWIPGGVSYLIAALVLFVLWLRASERRVTYSERRNRQFTRDGSPPDYTPSSASPVNHITSA